MIPNNNSGFSFIDSCEFNDQLHSYLSNEGMKELNALSGDRTESRITNVSAEDIMNWWFKQQERRMRPDGILIRKPGIQNLRKFMESVEDYGVLNDLLPGNNRFMDIDGILEKNNKFLVLEHKVDSTATVRKGAHLVFRALSKTNLFTTIVIHGCVYNPTHLQVYYPSYLNKQLEKKAGSFMNLKSIIEWWLEKEVPRIIN
ncbi:hypothetical protein [Mesobacillus foraminis]|uniref:hypothetical protein n=1 Tax=Mesobacillus foraminis TaxID=279826 RepID=UPI000EF488CA|nr:hypothetical protein [Mesobacillus foraminis]